jgi:miniconductance mechanosensitive channel
MNGTLQEIWVDVNHYSGVFYLLLVAFFVYVVVRRFLTPVLRKIALRTPIKWDDYLVDRGAVERLILLVPPLFVVVGMPLLLNADDPVYGFLHRVNNSVFIIVGFLLFESLLSAALDVYQSGAQKHKAPIRGVVQFAKLLGLLVSIVMILSMLADRSPLFFLSGIGALTAVLLLIFKDALLGLVAGIQITTMDLVRQGDWIEMPRHGADGDVIDVSLTTVRVQNWDRTITAIPAYDLVSSSFKNWRGMSESGGRRIKRSISIDLTSVKFIDKDVLHKLEKIKLLRPYLNTKVREIEEHNRQNITSEERLVLVNGRNLTNLGTFRAYCLAYLKSHSGIHQEMILMVRQLDSGSTGIPLEIYAFTNDINWIAYEGIQSDIFDHLYAVLPEFGLRAYQSPSGTDLREIGHIIPAVVAKQDAL